MLESDGIFGSEVNVAIADSAHDINYCEIFKRIREVMSTFREFKYASENIIMNALG